MVGGRGGAPVRGTARRPRWGWRLAAPRHRLAARRSVVGETAGSWRGADAPGRAPRPAPRPVCSPRGAPRPPSDTVCRGGACLCLRREGGGVRPVADVLRRIVARRREVVAGASDLGLEMAARAEPLGVEENAFLAALAARRGRAVIAEVKMGSPRIGSLAGRVDPVAQARRYAANGAAA
ncbi:MAG TPA: hypothetical protein VMR44_01040, partial [Thermoanaerobaculia bacterium]|nr:hypothetical protein [Thermoanaerobaculia bacterium]